VEPDEAVVAFVADDRDQLAADDAVILIVEDDPRFAAILLALVQEAGFKGVISREGAVVCSLARRYAPQAILLDVGLPDMDGLALLDLLKRTPDTRHIPVQMISADDQARLGLSIGAFGVTSKPAKRDALLASLKSLTQFAAAPERPLVLLSADAALGKVLERDFGAVTRVNSLKALAARGGLAGSGLVVDAAAAPVPALCEFLKTAMCPAVVYAPGLLDPEDERRLRLAVFGGYVRLARTPPQLVAQVTLLRHEPTDRLPDALRNSLAETRKDDPILMGRTTLVIDDDIRNIFSMASALEEFGVDLRYAESGRAGLDLLAQLPDIDVVLVDIMMPDMDGYETMRRIRSLPRYGDLPIIAVTAKAMKGDRLKCIEAGASDYVSKPVDIDYLISVMRVSIQRAAARGAMAPTPSPNPPAPVDA
jgi:CheY-like chemotaxis protein